MVRPPPIVTSKPPKMKIVVTALSEDFLKIEGLFKNCLKLLSCLFCKFRSFFLKDFPDLRFCKIFQAFTDFAAFSLICTKFSMICTSDAIGVKS